MEWKDGMWFGNIHDSKIREVLKQEMPPNLILFINDNEMSRQMTTQLQQIIDRYLMRLTVYVFVVDNLVSVPQLFQVRSFPTLLFISKREVKARIVGACSRKLLESWVQKLLKQSDNLINH